MKNATQTNEKQEDISSNSLEKIQILLSEKNNLLDIIDKKTSVITSQKRRIEFLEEYLRLEKSKRFASSSEQTTAEQGLLFNEVEVTSEPEQEELLPEQPSDTPKAKTCQSANTGVHAGKSCF